MNARLLVLTVNSVLAAIACAPAAAPASPPPAVAASDWASIRAAYEAGRHAFHPSGTGWRALNPGQQWTTRFDARGFITEPRGGGWQWGLELRSYGFGQAQHVITGEPIVRAEGQRLTYQWDALVQEWWVNDRRGLEHGFVVAQRPEANTSATTASSSTPLGFLLAVRGTLTPEISADALGVIFKATTGAAVLNYSGLKVWDADGTTLASRFEPAGENAVRLLVDERGARYPLTIDPVAQQAYLKPAAVGTSQRLDRFGTSVAVSGDTVVVGANYEGGSNTGVNSVPDELLPAAGAAYVFVRSGSTWTQQAYLKPSINIVTGPGNSGDNFGYAVAISGDTILIGAPREDSSTTGVNSTPNEAGGNAGAAYIFTRSGTTWTQSAYLKPAVYPSRYENLFGAAVAISGDIAVVGSHQEDTSNTGVNSTVVDTGDEFYDSGAAYVFVRSGATWVQQAQLKPAFSAAPQRGYFFGSSVAVSGTTVVVGAPGEGSSSLGVNSAANGFATAAGAAFVFTRTGTTWTQQAYLKPAAVGTSQVRDAFGWSVAIAGETVVVGAPGEGSSTTGVNSTPNESAREAGAAYVFVRSGTTWAQQAYLKPANAGTTQAEDGFGESVAISGDLIVVGAPHEDSNTTGIDSAPNDTDGRLFDSGAAYVFARTGNAWTQQNYLKPAAIGTTQKGDSFGYSVAVSGETVAVGALFERSSSLGVNSTPNEDSEDAGAAYIFTVTPDAPPPPPAAPSRLINLSVLTSLNSPTDEFSLGYVVGGAGTSGAKPLVIRAAGPSLGALGVPGTLSDPKMELFAGPAKTTENDNWGGGADVAAAMAAVGAFAYTGPASRDSAVAASITTRDNSVRVTGVGGGTGAVIAEVYDATPSAAFTAATPRLLNISVSKHLGTGLSAGFVVGGTTSVRVLIRVAGPGLAQFGVPGTVVDPQLALFNAQSQQIDANNDWGNAAAITAAGNSVGAFALPANSRDAALVATLTPGNYSVRATGVGGTTGVALVEVYELP